MSYTVLAVKWRPRRFGDLVGQEHVVQALVNSLSAERLHHAYLFTGTRGVGKTTVARILAKALNCEQGVVADPCGVCSACTSIDQGRFVDLLEVDAASRTKVDDTRELLENVQYAPTRGRYKVYLIDEVHMLSNHSFNALLKTLEEPPPHVKFLLATTDPQKLPITVLSRCLQFNLKRLTGTQIEGQLTKICAAEEVAAEIEGLRALSRAADGSMRDALSMLDQAIAFGGGEVLSDHVNAMLGTIDRGHVLRLLEALAANDGAGLLEEVDRLDQRAPDYAALLDELMTALQQVAVLQLVGERTAIDDADSLRPFAQRITPEDVQLYYQIALQGKRDLPVSRDPRIGAEMTLLRMLAFRPVDSGAQTSPDARERRPAGRTSAQRSVATGPSGAQRSAAKGQSSMGPSTAAVPAPGSGPRRQVSSPPPEVPPWIDEHSGAALTADEEASSAGGMKPEGGRSGPAAPTDSDSSVQLEDWPSLLKAADLRGGARQLADHCELARATATRLELVLAADKQTLNTQQLRSRLETAISQHLGRAMSITITTGEPPRPTPAERRAANENARMRRARESMEQDPNVKAAQEAFGAVLEADSIHPTDDN